MKGGTILTTTHVETNVTRVQKNVQATFDKIYHGEVTRLQCPYCSEIPLRFAYTFVQPNHYRIWISCEFCNKEAHLRISGKPLGYKEEYVIPEFQKRDEEIIRQTEEWWKNLSEKKATIDGN